MHKRNIKKDYEIKRINQNLNTLFYDDLINKFSFGFIAKSINENKKIKNISPKNIIKFYPCLLETLCLENLMFEHNNDLTVTDLILNTHKFFQEDNIKFLSNVINKIAVFKLDENNQMSNIQKLYIYNAGNKTLRHIDLDKKNVVLKYLNINTAFGRLSDVSYEVNPEKFKVDNNY